MFEPQKVNNYYSLTLAMKIVTRESSPLDSETIKATSTVISLPVFDSNGQIKAMYIYCKQHFW